MPPHSAPHPWLIDIALADMPPPTGHDICLHAQPHLWLAGSWRLDNAADLARSCGMPVNGEHGALLLQLYARFGIAFTEQLLGDFSFALGDTRQRKLWLVRDPMGVRPLYYQLHGGRCRASDSLDTLLSTGTLPALNDRVVAEWCQRGRAHNQTDTFYQGVHKVPRASCCGIDSRNSHTTRYWHPENLPPLAYPREQDYTEHLQTLLQNAISVRLPRQGLCAAHSSGGLDSTPIAILAGRSQAARGEAFYTYNWCSPAPGDDPLHHEWADARQVAAHEGFTHVETGLTAPDLVHSLLHHDVSRDGSTMFEYEALVLAHAQQHGVGAIFSGFGGDEILTCRWGEWHEPAFRQGHWLRVWQHLGTEANPAQNWQPLRKAVRFGRLAALATGLRARPTPAMAQTQESLRQHYQPLMRAEIFACPAPPAADWLEKRTLHQDQLYMMNMGYHQARLESWALLGERAGVRHVYPYLDKRLVEFALTLPSEWYLRHGQNRYLYRQALQGLQALPPYIAAKGKPPESARVKQLIEARIAALSAPKVHEHIASSDSPYVDTQALLQQCRQVHALDTNDILACIPPVQAMTSAVLALNLGRMRP